MTLRGIMSIGLGMVFLFGTVLVAGAAPTGPLAQVIEGAKKEGTLTAKLNPGFTEKSMSQLQRAIKDRYGVDLKIRFTGSTSYENDVAEAMMEQKAGAIPSYDLLTLSNHVAMANKAGVLERVDWKPLLSEGTNPNVVHEIPLMLGGIVYFTTHSGLLYNPEKVKADEVPKKLADMAIPKWNGRGGIVNNRNQWLRWSLLLGKEKVLAALQAILKNGAIQGRQGDLYNRYMIGEIWFCTVSSDNLKDAREKGMPAAWQTLDFGDAHETSLVVRKGASHANAAKLVALYLSSPEGAAFTLEEAGAGNLYYPGNIEHEIRVGNQNQGTADVLTTRKTEILEFYTSKEGVQLGKEIDLLMQTAGGR